MCNADRTNNYGLPYGVKVKAWFIGGDSGRAMVDFGVYNSVLQDNEDHLEFFN